MNILLLSTSDTAGGAAIAARRLLFALNSAGHQAQMLVRDKAFPSPRISALPPSPLHRVRFVAERAEVFLNNRCSRQNLFAIDPATQGFDVTRLSLFQRADVVHLHWTSQAMLSLRTLERIVRSGKRIVWTMHDMWPLTGVCHQAGACTRWQQACGHCPLLHGGSSRCDLSSVTFQRKQRAYAAGRIAFVGCSDWLADLARTAPLLQGQRVESIPNPIDTDFFAPAEAQAARRALGLPLEGRIVLFVAYKATDPYKGIDFLREAMKRIAAAHPHLAAQLCLVVVGKESETLPSTFPVDTRAVPLVTDPERMRTLYRAADVLAMPTLRDNLPNTIVEAQASGVPCVGFRVGGLPQMVTEGSTGHLVAPRDSEALADKLLHVLFASKREALTEACRHSALTTYSEAVVARRYTELYESL